jgi:hypothetical protein
MINKIYHWRFDMNKKIVSYLFVGAFIGIAIPFDALATNHQFYTTLNDQATTVQSIVMGPALKIAGILGAAMGLGISYMKQSFMPFVTFGALGLIGGGVTPKIIDSMFSVSSMLLP